METFVSPKIIFLAFLKVKLPNMTDQHIATLGSPVGNGNSCQKEFLNEKLVELEKVLEVIDKLDANYAFNLLKICFSLPKLL